MNRRSLVVVLLGVAIVAATALLLEHRTTPPTRSDDGCRGESCAATSATAAAVPSPEPPPSSSPSPAAPERPVDNGVALRDEADRLIAEGKVREGLEVFRQAVEAEPTAKNHGDLGRLLYRLTAFDEAAIHLRAAAELDPMNADRWIALANVYYRKVDLGQAWDAEKRAREAEPGLELARDENGMRIRKGDKAPREP